MRFLVVSIFLLMTACLSATAQIKLSTNKAQLCYGDLIHFYIELDAPVSDFDSLFLLPGDGNKIDLLKLPEPTKFNHFFNPGKYQTALLAYNDRVNASVLGPAVEVLEPPSIDLEIFRGLNSCRNGQEISMSVINFTKNNRRIVQQNWFVNGEINDDYGRFYWPDSNSFKLRIEVVDHLGCENMREEVYFAKQGPKARFGTLELNDECYPKTIVFQNKSKVDKDLIDYWAWDWGIGKRLIDTFKATEENFDFNWNGFVKDFTKDGWVSPKLIIKYKNGCRDSFIRKNAFQVVDYEVEFSFSPVLVLQDSVLASKREVNFRMKPRTNAQSFKWSFGDPESGYLNNNNVSWSPSHRYTKLGAQHVSLKVNELPCPQRDTTWCNLPIVGPLAKIQANSEANDYLPIRPIPRAHFEKIQNDTVTRLKTGIDSIVYLKIDSVAPFVFDSVPVYGNARMNKQKKLRSVCNGDSFFINQYSFKATRYQYLKRKYKVESKQVWHVGNPIPTGPVYFPESGEQHPENMHDTDLFAPNSSRNLVSFTNNTLKYRYYRGANNLAPNASWDNIPGEIPDTVLNPAYPWASDSLLYFWDFGDKHADNCTSTVAIPNVHCQFSSEKLPQHLYSQKGVYEAKLRATDTLYQINSFDSIQILMAEPNAAPDPIYLSLNHKEQVELDSLNRKGRRGLILRGSNCVNSYQYPDMDEVFPNAMGRKYWIVFDAASDCDTIHFSAWKKGKRIDTFYLKCDWVSSQTIEGDSFAYQYETAGLKTVGLVVGVGNDFDTFFYRDYKPIYDPRPDLEITHNDSDLFEPYPEVRVSLKSTGMQDSLLFYVIEEIRFNNVLNIEADVRSKGFDSVITFKRTQGQPFTICAMGIHPKSGCTVGRYEQIRPLVQSRTWVNGKLCSGDTLTFGHETFYLKQYENRSLIYEPFTKNQVNRFGRQENGAFNIHQDFFIKNPYETARGKWSSKPNYRLPAYLEALAWDFDNDSVFDAYGSNPKWVFNKPGIYRPCLYIRDSLGQWRRIYSIDRNGVPNEIRVAGIEHFASPKNMLDTQLFCGNRAIEMDHILREPFVAGERVISTNWKVEETGDEFETDQVFLRGKGTYHLTYQIETNLGCKSKKSMKWPIRVIAPQVDVEYLGLSQACLPAKLQYYVKGNLDSSHWYVNGNLLAKQLNQDSVSLPLLASGKQQLDAQFWAPLFDARRKDTISCQILYWQNAEQIQVSQPIRASFGAAELNDENLYYFEAKPAFAQLYEWWMDGVYQTATNQHKWSSYLSWHQADSHQICVKIRNGDCADSTCKTFLNPRSNEIDKVLNYKVYPSLVTDFIKVEGLEKNLEFSILNSVGQIVSFGSITNQAIDVQMLKTGLYFLVIQNGNGPMVFKFIKG